MSAALHFPSAATDYSSIRWCFLISTGMIWENKRTTMCIYSSWLPAENTASSFWWNMSCLNYKYKLQQRWKESAIRNGPFFHPHTNCIMMFRAESHCQPLAALFNETHKCWLLSIIMLVAAMFSCKCFLLVRHILLQARKENVKMYLYTNCQVREPGGFANRI